MILEGIVTTLNVDGRANISPMGPIVDSCWFAGVPVRGQTSTTYANLKRTGQGVFHVTDDVLLLAQAAVGTPDPMPSLAPATEVEGLILTDACRWYAFRVLEIDDRQFELITCRAGGSPGKPTGILRIQSSEDVAVEAAPGDASRLAPARTDRVGDGPAGVGCGKNRRPARERQQA